VKTGDTRKTFHTLTFLSTLFVQLVWGLPVVCLYGAPVSPVLAYAVVRGIDHPLYEALAREQDVPYRTCYIVIPYFATLPGGVASNLSFGPLAMVGLSHRRQGPFPFRFNPRVLSQIPPLYPHLSPLDEVASVWQVFIRDL